MQLRLKDHVCSHLYQGSRLVVQAYAEELKEVDLTYLRYLVLLALQEKNGQTVNELGELLSLDSGTLSPVLKALAQSRYLKRERLKEDERTVRNFITPKGQDACTQGNTVAYKLFKETGFSEKEFLQLRHQLEEFVVRCQKILSKRKGKTSKTKLKTLNKEIPCIPTLN